MKIDAINFDEVPAGPVEIIVREGKATEPVNPQPVSITGDISAPFSWYEKRRLPSNHVAYSLQFFRENAHLEADRRARLLKLIVNPDLPNKTVVTGALQVSEDFKEWKFNEGWNPSKLAEFIRRRKRFFVQKDVAAELIAGLTTFEADVQNRIEKTNDRTGGVYKNAVSAVVSSNIKVKTFDLLLPLFDGEEPLQIQVELIVEPRDGGVSIFLESIEAEVMVDELGENIVKEQIEKFADEIPVIYK